MYINEKSLELVRNQVYYYLLNHMEKAMIKYGKVNISYELEVRDGKPYLFKINDTGIEVTKMVARGDMDENK